MRIFLRNFFFEGYCTKNIPKNLLFKNFFYNFFLILPHNGLFYRFIGPAEISPNSRNSWKMYSFLYFIRNFWRNSSSFIFLVLSSGKFARKYVINFLKFQEAPPWVSFVVSLDIPLRISSGITPGIPSWILSDIQQRMASEIRTGDSLIICTLLYSASKYAFIYRFQLFLLSTKDIDYSNHGLISDQKINRPIILLFRNWLR